VNRRAVVVGGCGFIGSRLALSLTAAGTKVIVLDVAPPPPDLADECRVEDGDVTDPSSLLGVFDGADVVYLAGALLAKRCSEDPAACWAVNIAGVVHAMNEVIATAHRPRVVLLSTGTVYASPAARYPVPEDGATAPANLYALSKLAGERIVASAAAAGGFPAAVLRLFTVYGPGPASAERGHLVAGWLECMAQGHPVTIFGDGEQTVDLTHVSDVVEACRLAAVAPIADGECRVYNIGGGAETPVRDLARWLREVLPSLDVVHVPARWSAPARQFADVARARTELGYSPTIAPEAGVKALAQGLLAPT
jgi:UDP-glucose 4-epimerase